jgi:hypothetical protein
MSGMCSLPKTWPISEPDEKRLTAHSVEALSGRGLVEVGKDLNVIIQKILRIKDRQAIVKLLRSEYAH